MKPVRLFRNVMTVGVWTMASRVLGFVRDAMIVALLGTGPAYSAFIVAFSLPNMFRRFFAEGAFNMAFVPLFSKRLEAGDSPLAFAQSAFAALAFILLVLTALAQIFMPALVFAMASGFSGEPEFDIAVAFGRIAFPYILLISLAAMLSGILNATGRFAAAAAAPIVLNLCLIGGMAIGAWAEWPVAFGLIWAVPVAGLLQLVLLWGAARRAGFALRPAWPRFPPEIRQLARVAAPAALATGVVQINLLVGRQVASYFDRAIDWMYTADRLYQLPLGVVGIAVGIVLLPDLSRRLEAEDIDGSRHALSRAAEIALALTIPAAMALIVIPGPLVSVLFERGRFEQVDVAGTALAVAIYGAGLPAFVLHKVLQPLYFARSDTKSPLRYALWALVINAVVAIGGAPIIGWPAAAWATTISAWAMAALLWWGTRPMGEIARFDVRFTTRLPRLIAASMIMAAALWAGAWWLADPLVMPGVRYAALAGLVAGGAVIYFGAAHLSGGLPIGDLTASMRRRGSSTGQSGVS